MVLNAVDQLKLRSTILDGEIVALDAEGIPLFQLLHAVARVVRTEIFSGISGRIC
jgi:ATP-dependent DNA ligase